MESNMWNLEQMPLLQCECEVISTQTVITVMGMDEITYHWPKKESVHTVVYPILNKKTL